MNEQLNDVERMILEGLSARQRELERVAEPVQKDWKAFAVIVESRLGLDSGSIGNSHMIQDGAVREIPESEKGSLNQ